MVRNNPRYIIGDSAYPCLKCLIVPFRDNGHLTNAQKPFNTRLSQCRVTIEHAFGILKQRFQKMYHSNIRKRERQVRLIYACCILHNLADEEELMYLEQPLLEDVELEADPTKPKFKYYGRQYPK
ncbi:hypothetical protein NQ314_011979 [Rhamnusium bicolor]|uniref:DDE Tnp4 domain-containing protein n=1 Tax=Rhamnusium bicolor TaxID=1586634 RepID=A0AAV8XF89_9CUCU|nr:hypothetical protein NQ314_011979 [Rhamnusium bicolor]